RQYFEDLYFGQTYYWRVRAINGVDTSAWEMQSVVTRDYVTLSSPSDLSTNQSVTGVTLNWFAHEGVEFYEVEWDTTNLFNSTQLQNVLKTYINTSSSNSDTYEITGALLTNQIYFWRVRAINLVDTSEWETWVFSTGSNINLPNEPTLIAPTNNSVNLVQPINFDWSDETDVTGYEIQYDTDVNFGSAVSNLTTNSSYSASGLSDNTTYFWRVRSINGGYYSDWSTVWTFTTELPCQETTSSISATECFSYVSPSTNYEWTTTGVYFDTIPNVGGCDSIIEINLTINTVDVSTTVNGITIISNANGGNYQWLDQFYAPISGEISNVFTPQVNGDYAVEVTQNGCVDTSDFVTISTIGLVELDNDLSKFRPYPNPSNGKVFFDFEGRQNINLIVYNLEGKIIYGAINLNNQTYMIDFANYNGVLIVEIEYEQKLYHYKIILE
ncbi:MAG: fibronectin type III domain-containing protein, partial [Putridiphycobacter sp.]